MSQSGTIARRGWTRKQKRIAVIAALGLVLALATTLVLMALRDQIVFFYSPSDLTEREITAGEPIRLGGLVKEGSWQRNGQINAFIVTDGGAEVAAVYEGIVPDLFREGQGVVAEGSMQSNGTFMASNVLAKHDENYVPKEVANSLRENGELGPQAGSAP